MPAARAVPLWPQPGGRPMLDRLHQMVAQNRAGQARALVSVCSAHPDVLRASLNWAERGDRPIIIETTSNQVNQDGGYTGTTPADFAREIWTLADGLKVQRDRIILGGDHLGPQAWRALDPETAMAKARTLVQDYVEAGYQKIHLDCSQGCAGEAEPLSDAVIAARAADLAQVCEATAAGKELVYIIGTEVPVPGGAGREEPAQEQAQNHEHGTNGGAEAAIPATTPEAAQVTLDAHEAAFDSLGLGQVKAQCVGLVVQPGVEFTPLSLHALPEGRDPGLAAVALGWPNLCLEAHSTDYQAPAVFRRLAALGFGFQKVGPALTFALRSALYALDSALAYGGRSVGLFDTMEAVMLADPRHWQGHYRADDRIARHFGLSDRIRYYWNTEPAQRAVQALRRDVRDASLPEPLLRQVFDQRVLDRAEHLSGPLDQRLIDASIELALDPYDLSRGEAQP